MESSWPPDYTVRISKRAKNIALRVLPYKGLEIVCPHRTRDFDPLHYINIHREWVEKQLRRVNTGLKILRPETIWLKALNEIWSVNYTVNAQQREKISATEDRRLIVCNCKNSIDQHKGFNNWLLTKGLTHLPGWLNTLSKKTDLQYSDLVIRAQKTIWGSCSASSSISLNCRLLFLEPGLVEYVIIHELCHTKFHNHSGKFWNLVGEILPNYKHSRRALKKIE